MRRYIVFIVICLLAPLCAMAATPIAYEYNLRDPKLELQGYAISADGVWSRLPGSPYGATGAANEVSYTAILTTGKLLFALGSVNTGSSPWSPSLVTYAIESDGSLKLLSITPITEAQLLSDCCGNLTQRLSVSSDGKTLYLGWNYYTSEQGYNNAAYESWEIQASGKLEIRDSLFTKPPTGTRATPGSVADYVIVATKSMAYQYNLDIQDYKLQGYAVSTEGVWSKLPGSPYVFNSVDLPTAILTTGKFLFALQTTTSAQTSQVITTYRIESNGVLKPVSSVPIVDADRLYLGSSPQEVLSISKDGTILYAAFYANFDGPDYASWASWNIQPSGKLEIKDNLLTKEPADIRATPGAVLDYVIFAP